MEKGSGMASWRSFSMRATMNSDSPRVRKWNDEAAFSGKSTMRK
jgi:hypothetical protein